MFCLILLIIPSLTISLEVPYGERCSCSEYPVDKCGSIFYCSWDGYECVDLDCSLEPQQNCQPQVTMYQCQWDYLNNQCLYAPYVCNQITEKKYCEFKEYHGLDCMWKESIGCTQFSCVYSDKCEFDRCSFWQGQCGEAIQSINCQSLALDYCEASDGQGQCCLVNDQNKCSSYDANVNCAQLTDNKAYCSKLSDVCTWDNNACRNKQCEDGITESDCDFIYNPQSKYITACYWTGTRCRTASDLDVDNFTLHQCQKNTQYNYKWQDSKCQQCILFGHQLSLFILMISQLFL